MNRFNGPVSVRRSQPRLQLADPAVFMVLLAGLSAVLVGVPAGLAPSTVIEASVASVAVALIVSDITVGFMCFGLLAFFDNLPGLGSISAAKAAGTLVALSWLATVALRPSARRGFFRAHPKLGVTAFLLVAWMLLSLSWASSASAGLGDIGRYALNLLLLPIIYVAVSNRRHAQMLIAVLVAGATLSALYGMVFARGDALAQGTSRLAGAGEDANSEAMLLVAGIVLGSGLACVREFSPKARLVALGAVLIQLVGLVDTVSRGGLVGLAAVIVLGIVLAGRRRRLPLALGAGAGALSLVMYYITVASPAAVARITTLNSGSGRTDIWTVAWRMVKAHFLNGVGVGNFTQNTIHYLFAPGAIPTSKYIVDIPEVAHNMYLQVFAEIGVIGLVLFLAVLGGLLWCGLHAAWEFARIGDHTMETLSRAVLSSIGGMLATNFFISDQFNKILWIELALCPCLLMIARRQPSNEHAVAAAQPTRTAALT